MAADSLPALLVADSPFCWQHRVVLVVSWVLSGLLSVLKMPGTGVQPGWWNHQHSSSEQHRTSPVCGTELSPLLPTCAGCVRLPSLTAARTSCGRCLQMEKRDSFGCQYWVSSPAAFALLALIKLLFSHLGLIPVTLLWFCRLAKFCKCSEK